MNGVQKGDHVSGATLSGAEVRRQRNRREMRNAILEEASRIVAEDGLEALSIRAIARNLGYSAGALYEYFRDKDAIIHGLYFKGADGVGAAMERGLSALPDDVDVLDRVEREQRRQRAGDVRVADRGAQLLERHAAHGLGLRTIAEGVETETQATLLRAAGCDVVQGFLYGRPMPIAAIHATQAPELSAVGI